MSVLDRFSDATGASSISREATLLFSHRVFMRIGLAALSAFTVIRIFQYFDNSLVAAALVFLIVHVIVFFLTPLTAHLIGSWGIKRLLIVATPLAGIALASMAFLEHAPFLVLGIYITTLAVYKSLYWVPYQVDFASSLDSSSRGRQVAFLQNASSVLIALTPLVAGFLIHSQGFGVSFLTAAAFIFIALIPLFFSRAKYERYEWSFAETLRQFASSKNRNLIFAYIGDGMQSIALTVGWILFVFVLVGEEYITLGIVSALTLLLLLILRTITGRLFDTWSKERVLMVSTVLTATGWIVKLFVGTPIQVLFSDTYHGMGRVTRRTSIDAMTYEQAADNGHFIDEYTALKEMALSVGRVIMHTILILGAIFLGFEQAIFISIVIAAVATLTSMMLARRVRLG